jgi:hypothetical protein
VARDIGFSSGQRRGDSCVAPGHAAIDQRWPINNSRSAISAALQDIPTAREARFSAKTSAMNTNPPKSCGLLFSCNTRNLPLPQCLHVQNGKLRRQQETSLKVMGKPKSGLAK